MRHTLLVFVVALAAVAMLDRPAAAEDCGGCESACSCCEPCWTVSAGSIILHRSKARTETLVENGRTGAELANVGDFDLGWAAGPQVELTHRLNPCWDISLRYFQVDGWNAERRLADAGNLRVPMVSDDPADFFDTAFARYSSRLYNTELNLKRQCGERLRLLAGFRWVELHEQISSGAYSQALEGTFDVGTANHLYGFQMGAEADLYECGPWRLDGFVKAGVYGNTIRMNVRGQGTNFDLEGAATERRTSFLGELGLMAKYRLGCHWSAYGGYQVMWIEGVALAGDSVAAFRQASADMLLNGTAFYHGAVVGLECSW
jgi:hypothetical protein